MATKIICRATDCIFWEDKLCTSDEIIYDPEEGCLTYEVLDDMVDLAEEEWEEDELAEEEEEEDLDWDEEEDEDLFMDEEEDFQDEDEDDWLR